jgi:hypothetical protein
MTADEPTSVVNRQLNSFADAVASAFNPNDSTPATPLDDGADQQFGDRKESQLPDADSLLPPGEALAEPAEERLLMTGSKCLVSILGTNDVAHTIDDGSAADHSIDDVADESEVPPPTSFDQPQDESEEPPPAGLDVLRDDVADRVIDVVFGTHEDSDEREVLELADGPASETEHIMIDGEEDEEEGESCVCDPMEEKVDYVAATGLPPAPEEWEEVLNYAQRKEIDALLADDYDNARRYKRTEDVIRRAVHDAETHSDKNKWQDSIDARIANLNRQIEEVTAKWDEKIRQLEAASADRRSQMESRHAEDEAVFEEEWGSDKFLLTFNKASPALLQLRQIQRNQALSKDFDGALYTKAIADQRQEMEEDASQLRAIRTMRIAYSQMKARHEKEIWLSDEHTNSQRSKFEDMKAHEVVRLRLAIRQLEVRRGGPKPRLTGPTIIKPRATASVGNRPASPETRKSLYAYRTSKEHQAKLRIPGFDIIQHLHPAKPQTPPFRPRTTRRFRGYRY